MSKAKKSDTIYYSSLILLFLLSFFFFEIHMCCLKYYYDPQYGRINVQSPQSESTPKVSFYSQCSKMKLIPIKKYIIKTCFIQFLQFFRLKCRFKGQIIFIIHLSLPNAYKQMCFDRNINGNRDDKSFDWDYWSLH